MAWAALQTPFWLIDYAFRPEAATLNPEILNWADERACQNLATPFGHSCLFVTVFSDQTERMREAELLAALKKRLLPAFFCYFSISSLLGIISTSRRLKEFPIFGVFRELLIMDIK